MIASNMNPKQKAAVDLAIDQYATMILAQASQEGACADTKALGPYVTSTLRCSGDKPMLLELLQEQCCLTISQAVLALGSIAQAVQTGIVHDKYANAFSVQPCGSPSISSTKLKSHHGSYAAALTNHKSPSDKPLRSALKPSSIPMIDADTSFELAFDFPPLGGDSRPLAHAMLVPSQVAMSDTSIPQSQQVITDEETMGDGSISLITDGPATATFDLSKPRPVSVDATTIDSSMPSSGQVSIDNDLMLGDGSIDLSFLISMDDETVTRSRKSSDGVNVYAPSFVPAQHRQGDLPPLIMVPTGPSMLSSNGVIVNGSDEPQVMTAAAYAIARLLVQHQPNLSKAAIYEASQLPSFEVAKLVVKNAMKPHKRPISKRPGSKAKLVCPFWLKENSCHKQRCAYSHCFPLKMVKEAKAELKLALDNVQLHGFANSGLKEIFQKRDPESDLPVSLWLNELGTSGASSTTMRDSGSATTGLVSQEQPDFVTYHNPNNPFAVPARSKSTLVPDHLWNPNRKMLAALMLDPMERFNEVSKSVVRRDVIDLHFQSADTLDLILMDYLPNKLREYGQVWIVTGDPLLEENLTEWLHAHCYFYIQGKNGWNDTVVGALLVN